MQNVVNGKQEYIYSRASLSICSSPTFFSLQKLDRYTHHHNLICIQTNEQEMESLWTLPEALGLLALLLNLALLYQFHPECGGKREKKGNDSMQCTSFLSNKTLLNSSDCTETRWFQSFSFLDWLPYFQNKHK